MTPQQAFERLLGGLDRLEIPYMVGGSAASSTHGIGRATGDIDIVVELGEAQVSALVEEFEREFYVDAGEAASAIQRNRGFDLIHLATSYEFDLFPLSSGAFDRAQFDRRRFASTRLFGQDPVEFAVSTPEDVILSKLRWFREGGEVSSAQWNDVLGVIAVQRDNLDLAYLRNWAGHLSLTDLLDRALAERHEPDAR